jgi:hypothetical protein
VDAADEAAASGEALVVRGWGVLDLVKHHDGSSRLVTLPQLPYRQRAGNEQQQPIRGGNQSHNSNDDHDPRPQQLPPCRGLDLIDQIGRMRRDQVLHRGARQFLHHHAVVTGCVRDSRARAVGPLPGGLL